MEINILQRRIYLEPKYLDKNIMNHLLKTINKAMFGEFNKEYGYIISANRIIKIVDNENTFFVLKFEAKTYKPKIKQKVDGVVCGVYEEGIFIKVFEKMKILIPHIYLKDYKFNDVFHSFENKNNKIGIGDKINVEIKAVKYDKNGFCCIGFLV